MQAKNFIITIICMATAILSACTPAPPRSAEEEMTRYVWQILDAADKPKGTISFHDNKIKVESDISGEDFYFDEECMITDKQIIINSENYGVLKLDYKMYGENLELEYFGKKISLKKK